MNSTNYVSIVPLASVPVADFNIDRKKREDIGKKMLGTGNYIFKFCMCKNHLISTMFDTRATSRENGIKLEYWRENLIGLQLNGAKIAVLTTSTWQEASYVEKISDLGCCFTRRNDTYH